MPEELHSVLKPLSNPLDQAVYQKAARYAVRVLEEMSKRSQLLKQEGVVANFDRDEILPFLGERLGKGGFNSVYELEKVTLLKENDPTQRQRNHIAYTKPKLAVKFLSDEALSSPEEFCNGAADLLMEAKYLTALAAHPHPALIQLHGVCSSGPSGFGRIERAGFFLVIDRLYDTMDRRIDVWRELKKRKTSQMPKTRKVLVGLFIQQLLVGQDIASALQHLHKLQIIFRDLKPDNVGFDFDGRVKLFDFGLAKELDPLQKEDSGLYNMSGGTGSRRFMAPEVALSEPYHLSADMYSFSILLWELLTLDKAFARMSVEDHKERVIRGSERPELDPGWSDNLKQLLESCWKRGPFQRPSAKDAYRTLRQEIQTLVADYFPKQAVAEEERHRTRG